MTDMFNDDLNIKGSKAQVPVYYCLDCGYIGSAPGNCPECNSLLVADDVHLPNEVEKDERYDEELLEEEEEESVPEEEFDKFDDE